MNVAFGNAFEHARPDIGVDLDVFGSVLWLETDGLTVPSDCHIVRNLPENYSAARLDSC